MYCPECGYKIEEDGALFCSECGERIGEQESSQTSPMADVSSKDESFVCGIILTNIQLLAAKLGVGEKDVKRLMEDFIEAKRSFGVSYQLVDAGNYTYRKKNFLGMSKTVHLGDRSEVWDYMDILMDIHNHEIDKALPESQYLFIIGGDDIIPMPCVRHYVAEAHDKTIDTDILYAYPYGSDMLTLLEKQQIFRYDQLFFVGRLPVSDDISIEEFCGHLQRNIDYSDGIPVTQAYGQCDPNWKNVSATVADGLVQRNLFRNFDGRLPGEFYFRRLILSPMVTINDVHQVFHKDASLYYFNLHGGDAMESRGYFGAPLRQKSTYPVLLPEHLATCQAPNVIACEACYGARFIDMDKHHSMLLTSLYTASLLFVGSSRVAWGNVDPSSATMGFTPVQPLLADVIAMGFMEAILEGYSAGQAMFLARSMVLQQDPNGSPHTAATIIEFNLYGDPTLGMAVASEVKSVRKPIDKDACKVKTADYGCVVEKVELPSDGHSGSILQQVRQAVDQNIAYIHDVVGRYLYAQYGIEPRPASDIYKMNYVNGGKELNFRYDVSADASVPMSYIVRTTESGEIKSVITTR